MGSEMCIRDRCLDIFALLDYVFLASSFRLTILFKTKFVSVLSRSRQKYATRIPWNLTVSGSVISDGTSLCPSRGLGHGTVRLISSMPVSIIAFGKISSERGLMSERNPSGRASGSSDLKRGLKMRTVALMGLFFEGHFATQCM